MQDKTRSEFVQEFGEKMALLSKEEKEISSKVVQYDNEKQSIPEELKERQIEIRIEATSWLKRLDNINTLYPLKKQEKNDHLKFIPLPSERNYAKKELKIKLDELSLKFDKRMKGEVLLEKCEALADYQLELFKLESNSTSTKHSLMVIPFLEDVLATVETVLIFSGHVSLRKKLFAIKEVRGIVLKSDAKAKQVLEMAELGLHESNSKDIVFAMKQEIPKEVYSNPDILMFTPLIADPLFVAKTHIPMYGRILDLLDNEEDLVKIELRNGKSLDYSPLNDKKDNSNPTNSATEEDGKEDKSYPFKSLQIAIAVTMVNEKTGKFPKTDSKIKSKFIEDIEKEFKFKNVPDRFFREYASLQLSKEYFQNLDKKNKEKVKEILELGGYTELLKGIK